MPDGGAETEIYYRYRCLYMFHVSTCLMSRPAAHLSGSPASSQCGPVLPSQVEAEGAVGLVG